MVKVKVGEPVQRFWAKSNKWFVANVIAERLVSKEGSRRRVHEYRIHFQGERTARNDACGCLPAARSCARTSLIRGAGGSIY